MSIRLRRILPILIENSSHNLMIETMPTVEKPLPEAQIEVGRRLIEKGNTLRSVGSFGLNEALAAYVSAAALIEPLCDSETSPYRDDLASAFTNRGIALVGA